jgi:hypothetical protein
MMCMESSRERRLASWLARHHQVVTVAEAQRLGIGVRTVERLVEQGRLERRHAGVYIDTTHRGEPALTSSAAALAAVGPAAALSHRSAAWMLGLLPRPPARVDVVVARGVMSRLRGVSVHHSDAPFAAHSRDGLRVTNPVRTLMDVAASTPSLLPGMVDQALADKLLRIGDLTAATKPDSDHRRRGTGVLRAHLLERGHIGAPYPSVLESRTVRLFVRFDLPKPRSEVVAGWYGEYRVDFAYVALKLAIEVDGYIWHSSEAHKVADDVRRNRLQAAGWIVLVYNWVQVTRHPEAVAAEVLAAYEQRAAGVGLVPAAGGE